MKISDLTNAKIKKLRQMPAVNYDDKDQPPQKKLTTYEMGRNAASIGLSLEQATKLIKNSPRINIPGEYDQFMDGFNSIDK